MPKLIYLYFIRNVHLLMYEVWKKRLENTTTKYSITDFVETEVGSHFWLQY